MKWGCILAMALWGMSLPLSAQESGHAPSCTIRGFGGSEQFKYTGPDSIKNGPYFFGSELVPCIKDQKVNYSELLIYGIYQNNQRQGTWSVLENVYQATEQGIKRTKSGDMFIPLQYEQDEYKIRFSEGKFHGRSTFLRKSLPITKTPVSPALRRQAEIEFIRDTVKGSFNIRLDSFHLSGKTNPSGFFDGWIEMRYRSEVYGWIEERRLYRDGFLIRLEKVQNTFTQLQQLQYQESVDLLNALETKREDTALRYRISDAYFGLKYNIGYPQTSAYVQEQLEGNEKMLEYFSWFHQALKGQDSGTMMAPPILKMTRRFEYLYDSSERGALHTLFTGSHELDQRITQILQRPNVVIRREISDFVSKKSQLLEHIKTRNDDLRSYIELMGSDYFKHRSREQYFEKGLPGFQVLDTFRYRWKEREYAEVLPWNTQIVHSEQLLDHVSGVLSVLDSAMRAVSSALLNHISNYENQEKIDLLESDINRLESELGRLFRGSIFDKSGALERNSYAQKLLHSLNERVLRDLKSKYLQHGLPQHEMMAIGNQILCYYTLLSQQSPFINQIDELQKTWNDSFFTEYRDNPFDFRQLESKILQGTQHAATTLFRHYATQLLNEKSCEGLEQGLNKMQKINKRVKELTLQKNAGWVQDLDQALRRERVPNRIERLLEI
jgi:hypothetical protein